MCTLFLSSPNCLRKEICLYGECYSRVHSDNYSSYSVDSTAFGRPVQHAASSATLVWQQRQLFKCQIFTYTVHGSHAAELCRDQYQIFCKECVRTNGRAGTRSFLL